MYKFHDSRDNHATRYDHMQLAAQNEPREACVSVWFSARNFVREHKIGKRLLAPYSESQGQIVGTGRWGEDFSNVISFEFTKINY